MNRKRAACLVFKDNRLLLMYRNNTGNEYYTYIGGGIENDESPEAAVVRETYEESSIRVSVKKLLYHVTRANGEEHYFFLCNYIEGQPEVRQGTNEYTDNLNGQNLHIPKWVLVSELPNITVYPDAISNRIAQDISDGLQIENVSIKTN